MFDIVYNIGCAYSVKVMNVENGIGMPSSNSGQVHCIHFCTNNLGKRMNSFFVPTAIG